MDAFTSAFVIWSFVVALIGGTLPDALIPVHASVKKRSQAEAEDLINASIWIYLVQITAVTLLILVLGNVLVPLLTKEYSIEKQELTLRIFRNLAPFSILWGMSMLFTALLQAKKRFKLSSLAPGIVPLMTIAFLLIGYQKFGVHSLVYGIVAGASIHLTLLCIGYFRESQFPMKVTRSSFATPDLRLVMKTSWPYLLSGVVMGSVLVVDISMAAWLDPGSVAALAYAERVCAIGLTLAATATTEAFFPYLSELVASERWKQLRQTVLRFAGLILAGGSVVVLIFWFLAEPIVTLLFQRNEFTEADTIRVAGILRWLALQIPFYILAILAARVICALLASKVIFVTSCISLTLNTGLNYLLIQFMGIEGIALSTALVYAVSTAMLFGYFLRATHKKLTTSTQGESWKPE